MMLLSPPHLVTALLCNVLVHQVPTILLLSPPLLATALLCSIMSWCLSLSFLPPVTRNTIIAGSQKAEELSSPHSGHPGGRDLWAALQADLHDWAMDLCNWVLGPAPYTWKVVGWVAHAALWLKSQEDQMTKKEQSTESVRGGMKHWAEQTNQCEFTSACSTEGVVRVTAITIQLG